MDETMPARKPTRVVFDIGNVLLHWNPRLIYQSIFQTEAEIDDFLTRVLPPEWNLEQDRGRSWKDAEAEKIALFPEHEAAIRAFRARWRESVPHAIDGTVEILARLKQAGVPLYAITNFASDTFAEAQGMYLFLSNTFIDIVVSADEKLLKPDLAIYRVLLDRQGLSAEDCVFIDDSPKNVDAAHALGFHARLFTTPEVFGRDLRALGFVV
jgi:2-haloacid dehalogenase